MPDRGDGVQRLLVLVLIAGLLPLGACFKVAPEVIQPAVSITVFNPNSSPLFAGQPRTITAQVYDPSGQGVTWSVSPLNFGTLGNPTFEAATPTSPATVSVTYTAPAIVATPTNVTVTATSITNPTVSFSVTLHCAPIVIALQPVGTTVPLTAQAVGPGGFVGVQATVLNDPILMSNGLYVPVTWSLSPSTGAGSLSADNAPGIFTANYTAPGSVSAPITAVITATSVTDPTISASVQVTILPYPVGGNVAVLNVNGGPVPGQVYPNRAFTSVTICNPGSYISCQTVDGVLVDTGSYGLRILQSAIASLKLSTFTDPYGNVLENCAALPEGSLLWGGVAPADVYIAGEAAANLPIQVIPSTPTSIPDGCSNTGAFTISTPQLLGANGILGIGPEPTDCTLSGMINNCDGSQPSTPPRNVYYSCPSTGCAANASPVIVPAVSPGASQGGLPGASQVANPVPYFGSAYGNNPNSTQDYNGVVIQLPDVSDPQASAVGTLTFGIGTRRNNSLGSATVLTLDANDHFTTTINGQTLTGSFIDSGSNALLFPNSLFPNSPQACTTNLQFYCPTSPVMFSATNTGVSGAQPPSVSFTVEDADSLLFAFPQDSVFPTLAGPCSQGSAACGFAWGLPFFYGRTVYVAIDGQTVFGAPNGPWWAF